MRLCARCRLVRRATLAVLTTLDVLASVQPLGSFAWVDWWDLRSVAVGRCKGAIDMRGQWRVARQASQNARASGPECRDQRVWSCQRCQRPPQQFANDLSFGMQVSTESTMWCMHAWPGPGL